MRIETVTLLAALAASDAAAADRRPGDPPMEPAVARCVLENLNRAGWTDGSLVEKACRALLSQGDGGIGQPVGRGPGSYLVQCRVPTDPAWVEFRLISRDQCDRLNGSAN
jgi:hypothetical protein